jgi:hypothetical protein
MDRHNGIMIVVMAVIALACIAAAYSLALHGKEYGAFTPIAIAAIAALTPSALKQAQDFGATVKAQSVGSVVAVESDGGADHVS